MLAGTPIIIRSGGPIGRGAGGYPLPIATQTRVFSALEAVKYYGRYCIQSLQVKIPISIVYGVTHERLIPPRAVPEPRSMQTSMEQNFEQTYQERLATLPKINGNLAKRAIPTRYGISNSSRYRHSIGNRSKLALLQIQAFLRTCIHSVVCLWTGFPKSLLKAGSRMAFRSRTNRRT